MVDLTVVFGARGDRHRGDRHLREMAEDLDPRVLALGRPEAPEAFSRGPGVVLPGITGRFLLLVDEGIRYQHRGGQKTTRC